MPLRLAIHWSTKESGCTCGVPFMACSHLRRIIRYLNASEKLVENMGNFFGSSFSLRFTFATILTLPRYLTSAFAPSILLTISLAVKDIKDALSQSNLNDSELREKVSEHTAELEDMLKKEKSENKFYGLLFFLSLLFIIVFAFITYMDNEDLRNTITEKKTSLLNMKR